VMVINGKWANGKPLTAIPNFARMNRTGELPQAASAGDPSVNYAPGSTASTPAATPAPRRVRASREIESIVWMKD